MRWMLYGVTGYTGRLVAEAAARRGLQPVLAGRDTRAVGAIAERPAGKRTARQEASLRAWFLEHGPGKKEYDAYLRARAARAAYARKLPTTMVMAENPVPKETFIRKRGVYNDYGERVTRDVPAIAAQIRVSC